MAKSWEISNHGMRNLASMQYIRFEDKNLKSALVREENLRIILGLPAESTHLELM